MTSQEFCGRNEIDCCHAKIAIVQVKTLTPMFAFHLVHSRSVRFGRTISTGSRQLIRLRLMGADGHNFIYFLKVSLPGFYESPGLEYTFCGVRTSKLSIADPFTKLG